MNTFDKFIATARTFSIYELDSNDIFDNFIALDNKYSGLLNYNGDELNLESDIKISESENNLIRLGNVYFVIMKDEVANDILDQMTAEEKIAFFNLTKDYINLNMKKYEKKKTI